MLEVLQILFNGAEVKKIKDNIPTGLEVNVAVEKVTSDSPTNIVLDFVYSVTYKPGVASVKIMGQAYCRDTPENIKKVLTEHKKKKPLPPELVGAALNMINANAGMNSVFLVRPFNMLPPYMPPPLVGFPTSERRKST